MGGHGELEAQYSIIPTFQHSPFPLFQSSNPPFFRHSIANASGLWHMFSALRTMSIRRTLHPSRPPRMPAALAAGAGHAR